MLLFVGRFRLVRVLNLSVIISFKGRKFNLKQDFMKLPTSPSFSLINLNAKTLQISHQYFDRSPFTQHCENPVLPCQCSDTHSSFLSLPVVCTIEVTQAFNHILDHMLSLYACKHCFSAHLLCEAASTDHCLLSIPLFIYACLYFYVSRM